MVRLVLAFLLMLALGVPLAHADRYDDCIQTRNLDKQIRGCTQIIKWGKRETQINRTVAYLNRGNAYDKKGLYDRAIANYDKAIKLNPKHANAYNNRGRAYGEKGLHDRAIADYDKAIKLNPKHAKAYNNRGITYEVKGDKERAIADYRKALQIQPLYTYAKDALKRLGVTP